MPSFNLPSELLLKNGNWRNLPLVIYFYEYTSLYILLVYLIKQVLAEQLLHQYTHWIISGLLMFCHDPM